MIDNSSIPYIPLFNSTNLSHNSLLNSKKIINYAITNQLKTIGICEYMNFFSLLDFAREAKKNGIKPIFSCVVNLFWRGKFFGDLIVFPKNQLGFEEISKIISDAYINNFFHEGNCYLNLEDILKCTNLIVIVGKNNILQNNIANNNIDFVENFLKILHKSLNNNLYISIDLIEDNKSHNNKRIFLADILSIPLIYYHQPLFANMEESFPYYIFHCILNKKQYNDDEFATINQKINSFIETKELQKKDEIIEEAWENTYYLAIRCNFYPIEGDPKPPYFIEDPIEEQNFLRQKAIQGLKQRTEHLSVEELNKYFARLEMEMEVITSKNFSGYFLIVSDFINWAKDHGILVGAGRGSGAGSIVAWSLGITDIDPLQFGLLFERFLNPERISMPDFDIDFEPNRREEVLNYVIQKYGRHNCAHIITFGLMKAKMVIRDVGRVLGFSYYDVDKIAKIIPHDQIRPVKLSEVLEKDPRLQEMYQQEPKIKRLIDISLILEGLPRNLSIHAAGFIISNTPLYKYAPFYIDKEGGALCMQLNMHQVADVGLIKFDFLALKTLTIIQEIHQLVLKNKNKKLIFYNREFDDVETYKVLSTGLCDGIFQFESTGIQEKVVQLQPDNINDIIALISLFRPGPIGQILHYIQRKHGLEKVEYDHPILENILAPTYGVIVYQEQVMAITQVMGNYSLGKADIIRKAMGKKKLEEMIKQEKDFIEGAKKNNISEEIAKKVFDHISLFAGYAFNKSHAASYGVITYNTAYLKAHYMEEFYAVILNNDIHDSAKIVTFILEFRKFNGIILDPNINKSHDKFTVVGEKKILYGLTAIRGVGNYGEKIYEERKINGEYLSFQNFLYRHKEINKKVLKTLVYSGCFDIFDDNRCKIMTIGEIFLETKFAVYNTMDKKKWSLYKTIASEQEAFGFFLKKNFLDVYYTLLESKNIGKIKKILNALEERDEVTMQCAAILEKLKKRKTATGKAYAFLSIMDGENNIELTAFSKVLNEKYNVLQENALIIFTINGRKEGGTLRFSVRNAESIEEFLEKNNYSIIINVEKGIQNRQILTDLLIKENKNKGKKNITIIFHSYYSTYTLKNYISYNQKTIEQLDNLGIEYNYGLV